MILDKALSLNPVVNSVEGSVFNSVWDSVGARYSVFYLIWPSGDSVGFWVKYSVWASVIKYDFRHPKKV